MIVDMVLLVTSHLGASWTNYVVLTAESIYEQPFAQLTPYVTAMCQLGQARLLLTAVKMCRGVSDCEETGDKALPASGTASQTGMLADAALSEER